MIMKIVQVFRDEVGEALYLQRLPFFVVQAGKTRVV
jgi:hypothetical protein